MKYMGSKNRIAKELIEIMTSDRTSGQCWVEPFVGGGNMIDKIEGYRIGSDTNRYAIEALVSIRDSIGNLPRTNQEFTEADYKRLRASDDYEHKGYAAFAFSYSGKFMGGWARDSKGERDYVAEAYRNAVKQSKLLQGVELYNLDYDVLVIPPNSIIYCDPPYIGTTGYKVKFDHTKFWRWAIERALQGHKVYVSEYEAPSAFKCIWEKSQTSSLTQNTGSKRATEKLFTLK